MIKHQPIVTQGTRIVFTKTNAAHYRFVFDSRHQWDPMIEDSTKRFTGRAFLYSTSRPNYPHQVLDILRTKIDFDGTYITADIGSGTGLLSQLFLENGNRVLAVEPNDEMRGFAE